MPPKPFWFALLFGLALAQLGFASSCAKADTYEIVLEDTEGRRLPTYAHQGTWFAQGQHGDRYNVRVYNHSGRRVEAVVSVDGRDVLTGQPGDFKSQRGYLVPAYGSVLIEGFRTSLDEVAAFRFTSPRNSYSSRMGTPENVGVIGAAFFPEARPVAARPAPAPVAPRPYDHDDGIDRMSPEPRRHTSGGSGSASSAPKSSSSAEASAPSARMERKNNIGTEYGEQHYSSVREVTFRRAHATLPERVVSLRYDDYQGLVARGVLPRTERRPVAVQRPEPFPVNRFAPPPPPARTYWH